MCANLDPEKAFGVWRLAFDVWSLASTYPRTSSLVVNTQYPMPRSAFVAVKINCAWSSRFGITVCVTQITCQVCDEDYYLSVALINRRFSIRARFIPCFGNVWDSPSLRADVCYRLCLEGRIYFEDKMWWRKYEAIREVSVIGRYLRAKIQHVLSVDWSLLKFHTISNNQLDDRWTKVFFFDQLDYWTEITSSLCR